MFKRDHDAARAIRGKNARTGVESGPGIDRYSRRIWSRNATHGKLRIIGANRAGSDDDCVDDRSQAVQMIKSG